MQPVFQLDDNFLKDLGLDGLPDEQKQAFLQHIYQELELRVGTKLSEGLSEQQMQEFEAFVDQKEDKVHAWFEKHIPNFNEQPDFQQLSARVPAGTPQIAVLSEYGSLKWLEMNRPDYRQVVASELETLKAEISESRDQILSQAA